MLQRRRRDAQERREREREEREGDGDGEPQREQRQRGVQEREPPGLRPEVAERRRQRVAHADAAGRDWAPERAACLEPHPFTPDETTPATK